MNSRSCVTGEPVKIFIFTMIIPLVFSSGGLLTLPEMQRGLQRDPVSPVCQRLLQGLQQHEGHVPEMCGLPQHQAGTRL